MDSIFCLMLIKFMPYNSLFPSGNGLWVNSNEGCGEIENALFRYFWFLIKLLKLMSFWSELLVDLKETIIIFMKPTLFPFPLNVQDCCHIIKFSQFQAWLHKSLAQIVSLVLTFLKRTRHSFYNGKVKSLVVFIGILSAVIYILFLFIRNFPIKNA